MMFNCKKCNYLVENEFLDKDYCRKIKLWGNQKNMYKVCPLKKSVLIKKENGFWGWKK